MHPEAIPLPQYCSPMQYPKFAFLLTRSILLRPIAPTSTRLLLVDSDLPLYSIAKCRALRDLKSLSADLMKFSASSTE
jgi:hypothetical protein